MPDRPSPRPGLAVAPVGHALSLTLLVSYLLCVGFGLLAPEGLRMYEAWAPLLPGFEWITFSGFVWGLIGSYAYGWYIALVYVPLQRLFLRSA